MTPDPLVYRDVLAAMDACNGAALIRTWNEKWVPYIKAETGGGTDAVNTHCIQAVVADKLLQLAGIHCTSDKLSVAYDTLIKRAE